MKFIFIISTFFLISFSTFSQNWCPPNAEWFYNKISNNGAGYTKLTYIGTVTINSVQCQQINYFSEHYNPTVAPFLFSYTLNPYYTYSNNNVVFLLNQSTNNFDTLYDFSAIPGSQWLLPASYSYTFQNTCNRSKLTVTNTGTNNIAGFNLKWFAVQISKNASIFNDTIYERLGLLKHYYMNYDLCTNVQDYVSGGYLRCYNDHQILNYKKVANECNYFYNPLSIDDNSEMTQVSIFPNPTKNKLSLEFEQSEINGYKINLTNCLGQVVYTNDHPTSKLDINIDFLSTGIYYLKIQNNFKQAVYKISKE